MFNPFRARKATSTAIAAPIAGKVLAISDIPDPVFAEGEMGLGLAIMPNEEEMQVCAPLDGTIGVIHKAQHAFFMETSTGQEILVHIGIDTVKLNGEGFKALVEVGSKVKAGQPVIAIDQEILRQKAPSVITPVLCANMAEDKKLQLVAEPGSDVQVGTVLYYLK